MGFLEKSWCAIQLGFSTRMAPITDSAASSWKKWFDSAGFDSSLIRKVKFSYTICWDEQCHEQNRCEWICGCKLGSTIIRFSLGAGAMSTSRVWSCQTLGDGISHLLAEADRCDEEELHLEMFIKDCRLIYIDLTFLNQKQSTYVVTELVFGLLWYIIRLTRPIHWPIPGARS